MHPKVFERAKITQVHLQIKLPKFRETKISEADTPHLSVFSPNEGIEKRTRKTPNTDTFHAVLCLNETSREV